MWGPGKTMVRFQEPTRLPMKSPKKPRKETHPLRWAVWKDPRPEDDHYTGAIQGAPARKHHHCQEVQMKRRANPLHQQRETSSATTEANVRNHARNTLFQDQHLSRKMKIKEDKIDWVLKTLLHVPHSSRSATTSP